MKRISLALALFLVILSATPASAEFHTMESPLEAAAAAASAYYDTFDFSQGSWEDVVGAVSVKTSNLPKTILEGSTGTSAVIQSVFLGQNPYAQNDVYAVAVTLQDGIFDDIWGPSANAQVNGMLALSLAPLSVYDPEAAYAGLLTYQLPDGGFGFNDTSDVDTTAMAIAVMKPGDPATQKAIDYILSQMTDNGGFIGYTGAENACSVAAVITALARQKTEIPPELLNNFLSFQLEDGSFSYVLGGDADVSFSTPQAIRAIGDLLYGSVYDRVPEAIPTPLQARYADHAQITDYAQSYVIDAYDANLMRGKENLLFAPQGVVTKAELAVVLSQLNLTVSSSQPVVYSDVSSTSWYADAVAKVTTRGLMSGNSDGKFEPKKVLTRGEIAFWLSQALSLVPSGDGPKDLASAPELFQDAIRAVFSEGLMVGNGETFSPNSNLKRQDFAIVLYNLHQ
jgi:hypothetical protein